MYKYHYLYKITNKHNGKYYYGIHSTNDLNDGYMGSGKTLLKAYKKYGKDSFIKEYIRFFDNRTDILNAEREIVNEQVITDNNCYNIIQGGKQVEGIYELYKTKKLVKYANEDSNEDTNYFYVDKNDPRLKTGELISYCIGRHKNKVTVRDNYNNCFMVDKNDPRYLSGELKHIATGKNKNKVVVVDKDGNKFMVNVDDPRYLSGELQFILGYSNKGKVSVKDKNGNIFKVDKDDPRLKTHELVGITKGFVIVRDKDGNTFQVSKDDPRYLSGELKHNTKGYAVVVDKDGNTFQVSKDDPRYLSGELVSINKGKVNVKDKDGNRFRVSVDDPRYLSGELVQSTTGKIYIHKDNIVKVVYTIEDLDTHLSNGWIKGIGNNRKPRKLKSDIT